MKIRALMTAGLLASLWAGMAHAQPRPHWDAVLLADKGLFHYDPHSVKSTGQVRNFQSMVDYKTPQETADGKRYLSTVTEIQLNCKTGVARIMHMRYHADNMGAGKEVHQEGMIRDWLDIPAGSPIERIARRVC
ncbi:MAG: hypothetical protein RL559_1731 [Pseudomonadota bacterium]|jgi:hypothetical protein